MNHKFQKLTPDRNMDLGIYEKALDYAFSEEDVRNIAVSGAYGAGKSSVIESYEIKHPDRKFLHISLAHFEDVLPDQDNIMLTEDTLDSDKAESKELNSEVRLEGKILNQLIHQIDSDRIPLTDFKVKKETDIERLWGYTWWCIGFCLLFFFVFYNKQWCGLISGMKMSGGIAAFLVSREAVMIAGVFLIAIVAKGVHTLLKVQSEKKILKKVSLQGNDIEIMEECKDSYFDRYLNEVLYLFEHVDAEAIVFEDIDRFGTNTIFEKLREVNTLIGKRRAPLRFIYLLKDDIFESGDRTKFFDFIIPIVPVIDASNSYDKFMECFKEAGILGLFSEEFLQGLSLFIDDMRILKNIQNEFLIYKGRFEEKAIDLDWNKMLALLAYKNLFPKDFGELQLKRGYVFTLFDKKEQFCEEEINKLQAEIDELNMTLRDAEQEVCKNIDELNAIYFQSGEKLRVSGKTENQFASRADFVAAIMKNPTRVEYYSYSYGGYSDWRSSNIQEKIDKFQNTQEYKQRKALIEMQNQDYRVKVSGQISKLKRRIHQLENVSLKDFITRDNAKSIFDVSYINPLKEKEEFKEIKRNPYFPLIQYLIRDGYIDETYTDYMTYFYENSISANDKKFLRAVIGKMAKPYHYGLRNPQLIIEKLNKAYFEEEEILNLDLLDYLLENQKRYKEKFQILLRQIVDIEPINFVEQFLLREKNRRIFVRKLNEEWVGSASWILTERGFENVRANYVIDTLCGSSDEVIEELDQKGVLKQYLEVHDEAFRMEDEDADNFMHGLMLLNVKVKKIDYGSTNHRLFAQIYQENAYELNPVMVNVMLEHKYFLDPDDIDWKRNLTQIFEREDEPLWQYVDADIADYIKVVLENAEHFYDKEEVVLYVLNHEKIAREDKKEYLNLSKTVITRLKEVKDVSLWKHLLKKDLVLEDIENMCTYYFGADRELDEYLVNFMNHSQTDLSVRNIDFKSRYDDKAKVDMFRDILRCEELANEKYESLVKSFGLYYSEFPFDDISHEKMMILIKNNIIRMTEENLVLFREEYPKCLEAFIGNAPEAYLKIIQDENKFQETELVYLVKIYSKKNEEIDVSIQRIIEKHLSYIVDEELLLPIDLLVKLLGQDQINQDDRKKLLALHLHMMDETMLRDCLANMGLTKYSGLLDGKRPTFEMTNANEALLSGLEKCGWISSFAADPQNPEQYKAYGKKRKKREVVIK